MNIWQLSWWLVACHHVGLPWDRARMWDDRNNTTQNAGLLQENCAKKCHKQMPEWNKWKERLSCALENILLNWLLDLLDLHKASQAICLTEVATPSTQQAYAPGDSNQNHAWRDPVLGLNDGPSYQLVMCRATRALHGVRNQEKLLWWCQIHTSKAKIHTVQHIWKRIHVEKRK